MHSTVHLTMHSECTGGAPPAPANTGDLAAPRVRLPAPHVFQGMVISGSRTRGLLVVGVSGGGRH